MRNKSKTTWQCNNGKKMKTESVDASSNVSAFTSVEIAQETTACPSSSHDDQSEANELVSVNDSDIEEESGDVEVTMVTTCESERHASLKNLDEQDYQLINAPNGWLDCSIIQSAQVLLQKINPLIEGFQHPTLNPVRNFSIVLVNLFKYYILEGTIGSV